jgi:hypothetical protein
MTPREYLDEICEPFVKDFIGSPTSVRHAWAATIALFHFEDYLASAMGLVVKKDREELRAQLEADFPDFSIIRDIANANKHFALNRGRRTGLSTHHIKVGASAAFSDGTYFSDGTSFAEHEDVVRIEFQGEIVDLMHLCERCLVYLRSNISDFPNVG